MATVHTGWDMVVRAYSQWAPLPDVVLAQVQRTGRQAAVSAIDGIGEDGSGVEIA